MSKDSKLTEQESRSSIKVAIIAGVAVTLVTMFGSWAVWTTAQGFKAKLNETKIVELEKDVMVLDAEFDAFRREIIEKMHN